MELNLAFLKKGNIKVSFIKVLNLFRWKRMAKRLKFFLMH